MPAPTGAHPHVVSDAAVTAAQRADTNRRAGQQIDDSLRLLADRLAPQRRVVRCGEAIYQSGERFTHLHVLNSGMAKMVNLSADGREQVVGLKFRGDWLGFDGIAEGTDLVIAGTAAGDVAQNAKAMGELSVEIALQIIKGEKKASDFPKVIDSGMLLVHRWNVQKYRADFLGIK